MGWGRVAEWAVPILWVNKVCDGLTQWVGGWYTGRYRLILKLESAVGTMSNQYGESEEEPNGAADESGRRIGAAGDHTKGSTHPTLPSMALVITSSDTFGRNFTDEGRQRAWEIWCRAYELHGTIRAGCTAAGVNRTTYSYWMQRHPEFVDMVQEAKENYEDRLREEIDRRAREGNVKEKRVYYKGDLVDEYEEREFSDTLLIFQAKARMPEYREKVEISADRKIPWEQASDLLRGVPDDYKPKSMEGGNPAAEPGGANGANGENIPAPEVIDGEFRVVNKPETGEAADE